MTYRIQCPSISAELEMHVIAGRIARPADGSDYCSLLHTLTSLHQVSLIMRVRGFNTITVIDDNHVTIAAIVAGEFDPASGRCANLCSANRAQVSGKRSPTACSQKVAATMPAIMPQK